LKKVIYIHNNYEPENFPRKPDPDDRFFTYGFGSSLARSFKKYNPDFTVEMWRIDGYVDKYHEKEVQGVKFRIFPAFRIGRWGEVSLRFIRELRRELKKNKCILFVSHVHTWLTYQIAFLFGKRFPLACSHHGDWSPFFKVRKRKGLRWLKDFVEMQIEKIVLKRVDYFFVGDFFQIPYLREAFPDINYTIFSSGLDVKKMTPIPKKSARDQLGWDCSKKYILYVGKLYELKQPKELIDIWREIKKEHPEVELVIIGNSKKDKYYQYAVESGAMVLGRILNKELNVYYSAADVYVLLALRDDFFGGTGIAPLEALACNTPVVSYSLRNYIGDNVHEIGEVPDSIEAYKAAIEKVLFNGAVYKNMRESIERHYSREVIASKVRKVFDLLLIKYDMNGNQE